MNGSQERRNPKYVQNVRGMVGMTKVNKLLENPHVDILVYLQYHNTSNITEIVKNGTEFGYCAIHHAVKELQKEGFLKTKEKKRSRLLALTEKGKRLAESLANIKVLLNEDSS